jgi:uncharacterized protein YeaO (DUF488 family)
MLKESYLANARNLPKNVIKIVVTRSAEHMLSPSKKLLWDYKNGRIDWDGYVKTFYREMDNPACVAVMREIKKLANENDVYLLCYEKKYPCHRFLLLDMIEKLE